MAGKGPSQGFNIDNLDPAQRAAFEQILGADLGQLFDPQRQQDFFNAQVRDPLVKDFNENRIPEINEQFIGQGAASSSGLNRAVTQAGSDLQGRLAGELSKFQQQGQSNQMQLLLKALGLNAIEPTVDPGKAGAGELVGQLFGAGPGFAAGGVEGAQAALRTGAQAASLGGF